MESTTSETVTLTSTDITTKPVDPSYTTELVSSTTNNHHVQPIASTTSNTVNNSSTTSAIGTTKPTTIKKFRGPSTTTAAIANTSSITDDKTNITTNLSTGTESSSLPSTTTAATIAPSSIGTNTTTTSTTKGFTRGDPLAAFSSMNKQRKSFASFASSTSAVSSSTVVHLSSTETTSSTTTSSVRKSSGFGTSLSSTNTDNKESTKRQREPSTEQETVKNTINYSSNHDYNNTKIESTAKRIAIEKSTTTTTSSSTHDQDNDDNDENDDNDDDNNTPVDSEEHNNALLSNKDRLSSSTTKRTTPLFIPQEDISNGEENEINIFQIRAKLYTLNKLTNTISNEQHEKSIANSTKEANSSSSTTNTSPAKTSINTTGGSTWRDSGIGILRINIRRDLISQLPDNIRDKINVNHRIITNIFSSSLSSNSTNTNKEELTGPTARIIMRQESHNNSGMGMRLMLNTPIGTDMPIAIHSMDDRAIALSGIATTDHHSESKSLPSPGSTSISNVPSTNIPITQQYLLRFSKHEIAMDVLKVITGCKTFKSTLVPSPGK